MAGGRDHLQALCLTEVGTDHADLRARADHRRQDPGGDAQRLAEFARPRAGAAVEELAGAGDGEFAARFAAELEGDQVGHHQQPPRPREPPLGDVGDELVDRVDGHELDARDLVDALARDGLQHALHHAVGAMVAVGVGQIE